MKSKTEGEGKERESKGLQRHAVHTGHLACSASKNKTIWQEKQH